MLQRRIALVLPILFIKTELDLKYFESHICHPIVNEKVKFKTEP